MTISSILMTGFPTMGGSGLVALKLGLKLAENGYNVHFMFYKTPFFLQENEIPENVKLHIIDRPSYALFSEIGAPFTIQSASKIVEIAKLHSVDIVHAHYAIPHAVANYLASQTTSIKTVVTAHGSDTHTLGSDQSYNSILQLALKNQSCITSVSNFLARQTEEVFNLDENAVKTVYNFIEPSEFIPTTDNKLSITMASNFRAVKNIPFMIDVFAKVSDEFPDWTLDLIGYGPEYPICMRKAIELEIRDRVNFLGVRKDVPSLLSSASILASTSKIESFGLTIAEGMSCEVPIWAPNVGGIPEICNDGKTGLLYESGDLNSAVEKLRILMDDSKLRKNYGKEGRQRILSHFSPEVIVPQYESVYRSI